MEMEVLSVALGRPGPGGHGRTIHAVAPSWTHLASLSVPADAGPCVLSVDVQVHSGRVGIALLAHDGEVIEEREVGVGVATCWFAIPGPSRASQVVVRTRSVDGECPIVVTVSDVSLEPVGPPDTDGVFLSVFEVDRRAANFSFVPHLLASEAARRAAGLARMRLLVVEESPIGAEALPPDFAQAYPMESRDRFVRADIPAIAALMPSVADVAVVSDSEDLRRAALRAANRYPDDHSRSGIGAAADFERAFGAACLASVDARLSSGPDVRAEVQAWLDEVCEAGSPVTFTPRIANYAVEMNTDLTAWFDWAASAADGCVIIVPDFRYGAPACPEGPWIIFPFRSPEAIVALYQSASANLAMYGEMALLLMATAASFTVWVETDEDSPYTSTRSLTAVGLKPGETPDFLLDNQRLIFGSPDGASLTEAAQSSDRDEPGRD